MANIKSKDQSLTERLGSDLKFPIQNNFVPVSGIELLLQDIQQLLLTIPGERVNRPEYGCNLRNQIWENMAEAALNGAAAIREALDTYEPRITVLDVTSDINENTGLITFNIQFIIDSSDQEVNLIFPFRAGTAISFS